MPVINVPGVGYVRFPDDMSEKQIVEAIERDILKRKEEEPGLMDRAKTALKRGVEQIPESLAGIKLGAEAGVGAKERAGRTLREIKEEQAQPPEGPAPITYEELEKTYGKEGALAVLKKLPGYVTEQILQTAPSMAVPLAVGAAATPFTSPVGGLVAGIGTYGLQQFGQFMQRQAEQAQTPEELAPGRAAAAAAVTAPLGYFVDRLVLGMSKVPPGLLGQNIGAELAKRAGASVAGRAATGATIGVVAEAPTEVLEQMAERWQANLPLFDDAAVREYKEAAAGAAAVGGVGGAAARVIRGREQPPVEPPVVPERAPIPEAAPGMPGLPAAEVPVEFTPERQAELARMAEEADQERVAAAQQEEADRMAMAQEVARTMPGFTGAPDVNQQLLTATRRRQAEEDRTAERKRQSRIREIENTVFSADPLQNEMAKRRALEELGAQPLMATLPLEKPAAPAELTEEQLQERIREAEAQDRIRGVRRPLTEAETKRMARLAPEELEAMGIPRKEKKPGPEFKATEHPENVGMTGLDSSNQPIIDLVENGAKPFPTKKAADLAKSQLPDRKIVKVKEGWVLSPKTDADFEREAKAGKRMAEFLPGRPKGMPPAAHEYIMERGGLRTDQKPNTDFPDANPRVGNRFLFSQRGLTLSEAAELLREAGYIAEETETAANEAISNSVKGKRVYTPEGYERVAAIERGEIDLEAERTAEREALFIPEADVFDYLHSDDFYNQPMEEVRKAAEANEVDFEGISEEVIRRAPNATAEQYEDSVKQAIADAIRNRFNDRPAQITDVQKQAGGKATGFNSTKEGREIQRQLEGKSFDEVMNWVIATAPNSFQKLVGEKVRAMARALQQRGVEMTFEVQGGDRRLRRLYEANGFTEFKWSTDKTSVQVLLNGEPVVKNQDGYPSGMQYDTVQHELLHVATRTATKFLPPDHPVIKELNDLYKIVVDQYEKDFKAGTLPPILQKFRTRENNVLATPDELMSWGMTDEAFQKYLDNIKVGPKQTAFNKLVSLIREVLGMPKAFETALERLVRTTDSILSLDVDIIGRAVERQGYTLGNAKQAAMLTQQQSLFAKSAPKAEAIKTVAWSAKRIDSLMSKYSYKDGRTSAFAAIINPAEFLNATTGKQEDVVRIRKEAGKLDLKKLRSETQTPFLIVDKDTMTILEHEGRHRMAALAAAGVTRAPVVIEMRERGFKAPDKYEFVSSQELKGQDLRSGTGLDVDVFNMTPINEENRTNIENLLGETDVLFQKAAPLQRTQTGEDAMEILSGIGRQVEAPDAGYIAQVRKAWDNAVQNPKLTKEQSIGAFRKWADTVETWAFSSDAALNNQIRREIMNSTKGQEEKIGILLNTSLSQTAHSDAVANLFLMQGNIRWNPEIHKWEGVQDKNNFQTLSKQLDDIAEKHGLTKEEIELVAHTAFEAKRTQSLIRENAAIEAKAEAIRAEAARIRGKSPVAASELSDKAARLLDKKKVIHMKPEQIQAGMTQFELFPELNDVVKTWDGNRENALKVMVDTGLYSREEAENLLANADYVPFFREDQIEAGKGPKEFLRSLSVQADKRMKGSEKPVNDIFDNMVRWTQYAINRGVRNRSALALVDTAVETGLAQKVRGPRDGDNVVRVWRDGSEEYYSMADPMFVSAFRGLESVAIPTVKYASKLADILRQSVVLYPLFGIAQVPQDSFAAMFTSGLKPQYALRIPVLAAKEFFQTLRGKSKAHEELKNVGATGVRDFTAAVIRMEAEVLSGLKKDPNIWYTVKRWLGNVAMAADNAVRQATYEAALSQGLSRAEAMEKAFEIFNVRRRGNSQMLALAGQVIPFFNAYLAAQHVAYRTLTGVGTSPTQRDAAWKTLLATTGSVFTLSIIYAMMVADDEGYEKKPTPTRDRLLIIPGTNGYGLPLRADLFAVPKILGEHTYHLLTENGMTDPGKFRESMKSVLASSIFSPTPVPQAVKPVAEAIMNYDFFQQKPLVGVFQQKKDVSRQFEDSTSELSKLIGKSELISPIVADHLIRGMFGSFGGLALYITNPILAALSGTTRPDVSLQDAMATIPNASAFVSKEYEVGLRKDFYALKEVTDRAASTLSDLRNRSPQEIEDYLQDEKVQKRLALSPTVNRISSQLTQIRKQINMITNIETSEMSSSEKEKRIRQLREAEYQLLKNIDLRKLREMAQV